MPRRSRQVAFIVGATPAIPIPFTFMVDALPGERRLPAADGRAPGFEFTGAAPLAAGALLSAAHQGD